MTRKHACLVTLVLLAFTTVLVPVAEARYYHPTLGRWITRDPIEYPDGMNAYQYVGGNPTDKVDPYGLKEGDPKPKLAISVIRDNWRGSVELNGWPLYAKPFAFPYPPISPFASFTTEEKTSVSVSGVSFSASLTVKVWKPFASWVFKVCPERGWKVEIKNVCCTSNKVNITTTEQKSEGAAGVASLPPSGTKDLPQTFGPIRLSVTFTWPGPNTERWPTSGEKTVVAAFEIKAECAE